MNGESELLAQVQAIVFRKQDCSHVVARVRAESGEITHVAGPDHPDEPIAPEQSYRFVGTWDEHETYGRRLVFRAAVLVPPVTKDGMILYLTTLLEGVGQKRAEKLWDRYGASAAEVIRLEPARLVEDGILNQEDAEAASKELELRRGKERAMLEVLSLTAGRGFSRRLPTEAVALWGNRAAERIRYNPFLLLLEDLPGAGWKRCDKLWMDLKKPAGSIKRQVMAAIAHLQESLGDTWHDARGIAEAIRKCCGEKSDPKRALRLAERWQKIRIDRSKPPPLVALEQRAKNEERLAKHVRRIEQWSRRNWRYETDATRPTSQEMLANTA